MYIISELSKRYIHRLTLHTSALKIGKRHSEFLLTEHKYTAPEYASFNCNYKKNNS